MRNPLSGKNLVKFRRGVSPLGDVLMMLLMFGLIGGFFSGVLNTFEFWALLGSVGMAMFLFMLYASRQDRMLKFKKKFRR